MSRPRTTPNEYADIDSLLGRVAALERKLNAYPEATRYVGTPGNPSFGTGWQNIDSNYESIGFWMNHGGIVNLQGLCRRASGTEQTIFTLPVGYRPEKINVFVSSNGQGSTDVVVVTIFPSGAVYLTAGDPVSHVTFCGVSFKASGA